MNKTFDSVNTFFSFVFSKTKNCTITIELLNIEIQLQHLNKSEKVIEEIQMRKPEGCLSDGANNN